MQNGPTLLDLRLTIHRDGRTTVQAQIDRDGDVPRTLVAQDAPAQASCADANGNGTAGLVRLAFRAQDADSGEDVPVVLETLSEQDIDTSGVYDILLTIDRDQERLSADVTLRVCRRRRRRRRRRCRRL